MRILVLFCLFLIGCSQRTFTFVDRYRTTNEDPVRWYTAHYKLKLQEEKYESVFRKDSLPSNTYFELLFSDSSMLYVQADVGLMTPNSSLVRNKYGDFYIPYEPGYDYTKELDPIVFEGTDGDTYWKEILYPDLRIGYLNVPDTAKAAMEEVLSSLKLVKKVYK